MLFCSWTIAVPASVAQAAPVPTSADSRALERLPRVCVLAFIGSTRVPVALNAFQTELARIWRLNGVELVFRDAGAPTCQGQSLRSLVLWVVDNEKRLPPGIIVNPSSLGATLLQDDVPGGVAWVLVDRVVQWAARQHTRSADLPGVFWCLMGRLAAHEVGHALLRSAVHSGRGLMRPAFSARDLWLSPADDDGAYSLSIEERAAVSRQLGSGVRS